MYRILPRNLRLLSSFSLSALLLLAALPCAFAARKPQPPPASPATYVGSAACSRCHLEIGRNFAQASMGRSLTLVTPALIQSLPLPATYFDPKLNRHFEVSAGQGDHAGQLLQSEWATDSQGHETFRSTYPMEWIVGTGENGYGALLRRGQYLFQAPLSYYTRTASWALSPGYEHGDLGFNRLIQPGCIYCHSGRPQPVAGLPGKYAPIPFTQTSVGCENCHGPGSNHVQAMEEGAEVSTKSDKKADPTIVNPARLPSQLADDICMSCHQVGDARVLQPGKTYQDFRPGQPLAHTLAIFQIPATPSNPPDDDHLEHYYSMSLSKCWRATRNAPPTGQLRCITCHDPHVEPTAAQAPAYFNARCLTCHTRASCTAPAPARQAASDNCIGCHMPKRDIRLISHSTATNHRIVRTLSEPFPEEAFRQTTAALPDLVFLNAEGGRGPAAAAPDPLVRMQAYSLLKGTHPEFKASWLTTLTDLEASQPDNALVQAAAGHRDLEARNLAQAVTHLKRAIQLDPLQTAAWLDLSDAEDQLGQAEDAVASARRAVTLDPYATDPQKALVSRLISARHYDEAIAAMEAYMQLFPEDDFMRRMLTIAKAP